MNQPSGFGPSSKTIAIPPAANNPLSMHLASNCRLRRRISGPSDPSIVIEGSAPQA